MLLTAFIISCKNQSKVIPLNEECGMQNCHGLDVSCGQDVPQSCTADYQLGDFCRKFASCKVVNGFCQLEEKSEFGHCRSCVDGCKGLNFQKIFACESDCRKQFE